MGSDLNTFVLVQGQVNRNFQVVLNEMGPGRTSRAWCFHSPVYVIYFRFMTKMTTDKFGLWTKKSWYIHLGDNRIHLFSFG